MVETIVVMIVIAKKVIVKTMIAKIVATLGVNP